LNTLGKVNNQTREVITGTAQDDIIYPMGGRDYIDGGAGFDTLVNSGPIGKYNLKKLGSRFVVSETTGSDDTDYLNSVECHQFRTAKLVCFAIAALRPNWQCWRQTLNSMQFALI